MTDLYINSELKKLNFKVGDKVVYEDLIGGTGNTFELKDNNDNVLDSKFVKLKKPTEINNLLFYMYQEGSLGNSDNTSKVTSKLTSSDSVTLDIPKDALMVTFLLIRGNFLPAEGEAEQQGTNYALDLDLTGDTSKIMLNGNVKVPTASPVTKFDDKVVATNTAWMNASLSQFGNVAGLKEVFSGLQFIASQSIADTVSAYASNLGVGTISKFIYSGFQTEDMEAPKDFTININWV